MDYTGTRREGRDEEATEHFFFRQVAEDFIARFQPVDRQGPRGTSSSPYRHEIITSWRLAGYRFAMHLLPAKRVRIPDELDAFIEGLRQRLREYEQEHLTKTSAASGMEVSGGLDVDACEKIESKAQKFLRLASHAGTPSHEAASAAAAIVKMVTGGDLVLLSLERVRDLVQRHTRLEEAFKVARLEKPSDFLYGTLEQRENAERK